jgi:CBS domain-containing protein
MLDAPVRTLAHRPAVDVLPDASLRAVAETLDEESVGVAVVLAPHPPGGTRAAGLVSERDIVRALADGADPDSTAADDVMTADLVSVAPEDSLGTAARRMLDNEVRHLPVVAGDDIVGVISMRDLVEALLQPSAG